MDVPAGIAINDHIAGLHPGAPALWTFCQSCLKLIKDLIAKVLQASTISISVKPYFDPITRHLDNNLIRLEIWIFDTGIDDKDFKNASMDASSDNKLERSVMGILGDTVSQLKVIEERVEHMRAIASAIMEAPNQSLNGKSQLDEILKQVEKVCNHITSAVHRLVDLTEAIRMYLATKYQCGPLAGLREKIRTTPNQAPVTMDSSKEEGPWTLKNLLTLDGGGIRNYSTLLILTALMSRIAQVEKEGLPSARSSAFPLDLRPKDLRNSTAPATSEYLPCHYFDYIAGSGFGGILAIMLGRLRMTAGECLKAYELLLERVFSTRRMRHKLLPRAVAIASGGVRYDHRPLEQELKRMTKASQLGSSFRQSDESMCRTIVIAWPKLGKSIYLVPYLFRSYYHPETFPEFDRERNPGKSNNHEIWQVGRATSAAPLYFEAMRLEEQGEMSDYISDDHEFGSGNPSEEAYKSVLQVNHNDLQTVKILVSIGTGRRPISHFSEKKGGLRAAREITKILSELHDQSKHTHERLLDATRSHTNYSRLNVDHGLYPIAFDEWKGKKGDETLQLIRTKTEEYLQSPDVKRDIAEIARQLVEIRRQRSTWEPDLDRWERFCNGVEYACPVPTCKNDAKRYKARQSLRDHLTEIHAVEPDTLEPLLDAGKRSLFDQFRG